MEQNSNTASICESRSADVLNFLLMNTLGMSVLVEVLNKAKLFAKRIDSPFIKSGKNYESRSCFYFVQGTGLNILVDKFSLGYDPEELKTNFNYMCGLRRLIKDE